MDRTSFDNVLRNESEHLWRDVFPRIYAGQGDGAPFRDRHLPSYAETLWWLGWADGGLGQSPDEGEALVRIHADALRRRRIEELQGESIRLAKDAEIADLASQHLQEDIDGTRLELRSITDRRRKDPHEASLVTGWLYVLVAIVLILADMPLSLRLVADGFDMPIRHTVPGTTDVITFGDFFDPARRHDALIHLWEPIVLALGIAALGIFFKIVADYLLSTAPMLQHRPRVLKILKATFFTVALLLMVAGLWFVGQLRATQQSAGRLRETQNSGANRSFTMQDDSTITTPSATTEVSDTSGSDSARQQELVDQQEAAALSAAQKEVDWWARWSFVLMAIALPAIGGICFAIGWKRVQLSFLRITRFVWLEWSWIRLRKHRAIGSGFHERLAAVNAELEFLANTARGIQEVAPLQLYRHGYHRGFTEPQKLEPHRSLLARCKEALHFRIAAGLQERNIERNPNGRRPGP